MVGLAAPAVGPAPASRDASSFVIFSISVVHCPAAAVPMGKATKAQAPSSNVVVFMALLPVASESRVCGFPPFDMNQDSSERSALCAPPRRQSAIRTEQQPRWRGCCERDPNISALPVEGCGYRCGSGPEWDDNAPPQAGIVAAIIFLVHVGG